ncbi:TRAP transporter large permease subunit [Sulfitobacter sp. UBA4523]|uniref:TRAP transporter large permease subunit n=1 Tax=Sulfitobacter sp. UBA4523 TaxID=1947584 RepID=UPI00257B604C|nr:TRAP transporter large permease subunit [Sulfitobacter sp. UBA4523]
MLGDQYGFVESDFQLAVAVALLLVELETARRVTGWPLPLVAALALLYGLFGQYIPGEFGHSGTPVESFFGTLAIAEGGIGGTLTGVSVSVVAIFVIFGAVLDVGEAGQSFMNVAAAAAGRLKGGAAKVSVLSSALFCSISASANVASTGALTLPAMTKLGYPKRLAAAVEAVASSGGQIMPPLMGAGAFVVVELTSVPYTGIMPAAALPALMYFVAVWMGINTYARRELVEGRADSNGTWHQALYHSVGHDRQPRHAAALGRSTGSGARGLGGDVTLVRSDRSAPTHTDDRALRGRASGCILRPLVLTNLV